MPFAKDNKISVEPLPGGVVISEQEYQAALAAMLEGKVVTIVGGKMVLSQTQKDVQNG